MVYLVTILYCFLALPLTSTQHRIRLQSQLQMPIHEPGKPNPQGLQLWLDLPAKMKGVEPSYQEKKASECVCCLCARFKPG